MVVQSSEAVTPASLDLGYLALFLGLRVNEIVAEQVAAKGFANVRQSHGYVIQHLIEQDRTITELAARMEVTQQAASKAVAELLRLELIEVIETAGDRRAKQIRLSTKGWRSVKQSRKIRAGIEKQLLKATEAARYDEAKRTLVDCLQELGGVERIKTRRIRMAD